jgi:dUTPase
MPLRSSKKFKIPGHTTMTITTGIAVEIPKGFYGLILDSENLCKTYPLMNRVQVITSENREEISLRIFNYSSYPEQIDYNQVVGNLLLVPIVNVEQKNVPKISKLTENE